MPINVSLHVAFQVAPSELHDAPARLQKAGIEPRDFTLAIPDNNLLEFHRDVERSAEARSWRVALE
jgi:hypothetical protein